MKRFILSIAIVLNAGCATRESQQPISRIAFGSCATQKKPQPIWDRIVDSKPDLFLFIGDNVYADTTDMAAMRSAYDKLTAVPGYQKLLKTCPILATWDDHDYGVNDGGADYSAREGSQREFIRAFNLPANSPVRNRPGVYNVHEFGPAGRRVQVILLDTRYFRGPLSKRDSAVNRIEGVGPYVPTADPSTTMLGDQQWKWLAEQLRRPADLRILVSSIQVIADGNGWETWANMPHERDRLFKLIRDCKADGVVIISGDRHLAELAATDELGGYRIYDLTSSGLNWEAKTWVDQPNRHRLGDIVWGDNFGMIDIDWNDDAPAVQLEIHRISGEIPISRRIPLHELRFPRD